MKNLTDQQSRALDLTKHLSVTANAGSGKTRVLVERFVTAVEDGVDIERILCLTFSEKAALELREKIAARLNSELSELLREKKDSARAHTISEAKRKMLDANIGTIHAFCSQVLREFPVEAGVDANFKVLEDFDSSALKEKACEEAVRESLVEEHIDRSRLSVPGSMHDFFVRTGYGRGVRLVESLLNVREKVEHIKSRRGSVFPDEDTLREHWNSVAEAVLRVAAENLKGKKDLIADELKILEKSSHGEIENPDEVIDTLRSLLSKILTKEGTPRKKSVNVVNGPTYSGDTATAILELAFNSLGGRKTPIRMLRRAVYIEMSRVLVYLYERTNSSYSRKKYLMGALDFDDLQILTLKLLKEREQVRTALADRFDHVMVDEFQDTNFLQYDIFRSLLHDFEGHAKLFVVGDPKQSIYRFRNAQVEVSRKTAQDLSRLSDGTLLSLSETFRMNAELAAFVNDVFPRVMTGKGVAEEAGLPFTGETVYDNLTAKRPTGVGGPVEIFIKEKNQAGNGVEEEENGDSSAALANSDAQATFVAARIRQMVDSGEEIRTVKGSEKPRPIKFGDVAVLLRTRSRLPALEEALTEYSVPYNVSAGIGFYSAQEIYDLTSYLTFLLDNTSEVDLLTVLRSPFFGISENELYRISKREGESLYSKLLSEAEHSDSEEVGYAASVLAGEIQLSQKLTIPQLLNRILERTGWLAAFRQSPTGDQRLANLRKLLSIAREFESRGFNNLYDFVERLKYLADAAREGQAPIDEDSDSVKIMTVHAAKGLEFPVVIVPFCDVGTRGREELVINDHVGMLPNFGIGDIPQVMGLYKILEGLGEQAEVSRLFYVACTRAMDKLILTTASRKGQRSGAIRCFTDILRRTMDLSGLPPDGVFKLPGVEVAAHGDIPQVSQTAAIQTSETIDLGEFYLDQIPGNVGGEMYSATLLQTFKLCPTKYFLNYRLGMPGPERSFRSEVNDEYTDVILSTVKGQIIHSVLQRAVVDQIGDPAAIKQLAERTVAAAEVFGITPEQRNEFVETIADNAVNALGTLRAMTSSEKVYTEQTITKRIDEDFLTGTLDLIVSDDAGLHVFDYKTNRLDRSLEKIYSNYEIQMKLYALLCSDLKPGQDQFDASIIFTREPSRKLTRIYNRKELAEFEDKMLSMIDEIKGLETTDGGFPAAELLPTVSSHCSDCEYYGASGTKGCLIGRAVRAGGPAPK